MFSNKYVSFLEREVEEQKAEIKMLQEQIMKLQAAIVAKESPWAYEHFEKEYPKDNVNRDKFREEQRILREYAQRIEGPLFSSPDEMLESLGSALGPPRSKSIHDNSES